MPGTESSCSCLPPSRRDPQRSHRQPARDDSLEATRVIAPAGQARRVRRCSAAGLRNTIFVAHWRRAKLARRNDLRPIQILAILLFLRTSLLRGIFW